MPVLWRLLRYLCYVACPLGIIAFVPVLWRHSEIALVHSDLCRLAGYGFTAGCFAWFLLTRYLGFVQVFIHEMTHLLTGLLFLHPPRLLVATEDGGRVELYGGNFLVSLAPYCVPLMPLAIMAFSPLIDPQYRPHLFVVLGFCSGCHLVSVAQQFRFYQPDIRQTGPLFSILFCSLGNLVFLTMLVGFLARGPAGIADALLDGVREARIQTLVVASTLQPLARQAYGLVQSLVH